MTTFRVLRLLSGPGTARPVTRITTVLAFAVVGAVLASLGNAFVAYTSVTGPAVSLYGLMAWTAVAMLVAPVVMLVESAVTVTADQRNDRLATLRLLGAPARLVRRLPVLESAALAAVGSTVGACAGWGIAVVVGQPGLAGADPAVVGAPLGVVGAVGTVGTVTLLAVWRSSLGLRRVLIGPLGVRTRAEPQAVDPRALRRGLVVLGLASVGGLVSGWQLSSFGVVLTLVGIVAAMTTLRMTGPVVIRWLAVRAHDRAGSAAALIAARTAMESPFAAWRRVSGVTMTTFIAVVVSAGMALLAPVSDPAIVHDVSVTAAFLLACSYLLTASTVTLDEVGAVLDRRDLYLGLHRVGTPRSVLDAARLRGVGVPLVVMTTFALVSASVLVGPLTVGVGAVSMPSVVALVVSLVVGTATALLGVRAAGRLLPTDPDVPARRTTEPTGVAS